MCMLTLPTQLQWVRSTAERRGTTVGMSSACHQHSTTVWRRTQQVLVRYCVDCSLNYGRVSFVIECLCLQASLDHPLGCPSTLCSHRVVQSSRKTGDVVPLLVCGTSIPNSFIVTSIAKENLCMGEPGDKVAHNLCILYLTQYLLLQCACITLKDTRRHCTEGPTE